jgi:hypothetical protein
VPNHQCKPEEDEKRHQGQRTTQSKLRRHNLNENIVEYSSWPFLHLDCCSDWAMVRGSFRWPQIFEFFSLPFLSLFLLVLLKHCRISSSFLPPGLVLLLFPTLSASSLLCAYPYLPLYIIFTAHYVISENSWLSIQCTALFTLALLVVLKLEIEVHV